ncbi:MAG TPA: kelch repeat-containing protein [Actinomycetota bacterium]|nr:kelch repeat-containing protein [Actinomycetota bacterium]
MTIRPRWLCALPWMLAAACTAPSSEEARSPTPRVTDVAWRTMAAAPTERTEVAAALADGRIVVAGGFAEPDRTVDTVEIYDLAADAWSAGPPLPIPVNHAMAAGLGSAVFVFGGYTAEGPPTDRAFAFRGGQWEELPPMPEPRSAGGAAVVEGHVYVVGGVGPDGVATSTMVFDPASQAWSLGASLDRPREHMGVAAYGGSVYAVGGRAGSLAGFGNVEAYDPEADAWSALPAMPTPRGGMAAAATSNGFVVALGGEEEDGTFEEAEAFDVQTERWIALPPLPTPRHGLGVVADGTTVYAIAGGPQPGLHFSGALEAIDIGSLA